MLDVLIPQRETVLSCVVSMTLGKTYAALRVGILSTRGSPNEETRPRLSGMSVCLVRKGIYMPNKVQLNVVTNLVRRIVLALSTTSARTNHHILHLVQNYGLLPSPVMANPYAKAVLSDIIGLLSITVLKHLLKHRLAHPYACMLTVAS